LGAARRSAREFHAPRVAPQRGGQLRQPRGFTLVEVLVALFIMAAIAMMAWRGIDGMLRSREISQASLARSERLQAVLTQWEQDLRALQAGTSTLEPITFDGIQLRLTRRQPEGLQLVVWRLQDGRLLRWASPPMTTLQALNEAYARSEQGLQGGEPLTALEGLAGWQMYFFRGNAWSNAQSSGDVAAPSPAASGPVARTPPGGVRMVLEFADGGLLTRQVALGPQP
jgi:general secretion pathway protein J